MRWLGVFLVRSHFVPELNFQGTSERVLDLKCVVHVNVNKDSSVDIESHHVDLALAHQLHVAVFLQRDKL